MSLSKKSPWFQNTRPGPQACLRLFCFPYAGGGASLFRDFAACLPAEVEVWPVQLPGRENRLMEPAFTSIEVLTETLVDVLLPNLSVPYTFYGHSMGALISFELARKLQQKPGVPGPVHLFVSGRIAPQLPYTEPIVHHLPEPEFIEELRRMQGTPEEVFSQEELLGLLIPLLRADFTLCETYRYVPAPPLSCPITAFGGLADSQVSPEQLSAWREQTGATFKDHFFEGDHFFIKQNQSLLLQKLTQELRLCLKKFATQTY